MKYVFTGNKIFLTKINAWCIIDNDKYDNVHPRLRTDKIPRGASLGILF